MRIGLEKSDLRIRYQNRFLELIYIKKSLLIQNTNLNNSKYIKIRKFYIRIKIIVEYIIILLQVRHTSER